MSAYIDQLKASVAEDEDRKLEKHHADDLASGDRGSPLMEVDLEVGIAIARERHGVGARDCWVKALGPFPCVGHAIRIGVRRGRWGGAREGG